MSEPQTDENKIISHVGMIRTIRQYIKSQGISHEDFAKEIGIAPTHLSAILNKHRGIPNWLAERFGYRKIVMFEKRADDWHDKKRFPDYRENKE